jgi:hypothetical protein
MSGHISNDLNTIHVIWLDANQANDSRGKDRNSNIIGTDSYNKLSK